MTLKPTLHGQHMAIFQEKLYHEVHRVNVVVALEDKSTLNIAHITSTLLSPIHFSKSHKVVCSIKIAGVYVDAYIA